MTRDEMFVQQMRRLADAANGAADLIAPVGPALDRWARDTPIAERLGYPDGGLPDGYIVPAEPGRFRDGYAPGTAGPTIQRLGQELREAQVTIAELREQRQAATRRVAELSEQLARGTADLIADASVLVDSRGVVIKARTALETDQLANPMAVQRDRFGAELATPVGDWRPYDVELDTDGEPPVIADGQLVGQWRPSADGPGGEVLVRFVPGNLTQPGTGSRYIVTLPIRPPDGPPRYIPTSTGD